MRTSSRLWSKALKQYNVGGWIGGIKDVANHATFWMSALNLGLVAATAYHTTIFPQVEHLVPWFSFPVFLLSIILLAGTAMLVEYKIIIPSVFTFRNRQEYEHQNLIRKDIADLHKDIEALRQELADKKQVC